MKEVYITIAGPGSGTEQDDETPEIDDGTLERIRAKIELLFSKLAPDNLNVLKTSSSSNGWSLSELELEASLGIKAQGGVIQLILGASAESTLKIKGKWVVNKPVEPSTE